jgi:hypothetical protein
LTLAIYAHLPKLQSFREPVNGYFCHLLKRACSTKFERSAQKAALQRMRSGGQFAQEGKLTLALQWIARSGRTFLLYRLLLVSRTAGLEAGLKCLPKVEIRFR